MAAYGLYSHIQSNRRRSIALLIGLFFLVYVLVYAGALLAAALSFDTDLNTLMQIAWIDLIKAAPVATIGAAVWVVIAYYFHQNMSDAVTGGREIQRSDDPRLYTILENLCISRGIPTPKLKIIESDALNAFATGMNAKQYSITVTTGLLDRLDDAEIEAVLGHELTHIRNGDVRMMVVAVIIVGVISFFTELIVRLGFYNSWRFRRQMTKMMISPATKARGNPRNNKQILKQRRNPTRAKRADRGHNRLRNRRRRPDRGDRTAVNHTQLQFAQKHRRRAMQQRS